MSRSETRKRHLEKLKTDPEKYAEYLRKDRERHARNPEKRAESKAKWYANLKADPVRYAEYLRRRNESSKTEHRQEKKKEYRAANREKLKKDKRKWAGDNRERLVAKRKEYRQANREKLNEIELKYWKAHPEKRAAIMRKYQKAHPEVGVIAQSKRRALKLNAPGGSHTKAEWQALKSYYMDQCLCCGDVPDVLECDHVVPLAKGGSDDISNCQPLCRSCNATKNARTIDYR